MARLTKWERMPPAEEVEGVEVLMAEFTALEEASLPMPPLTLEQQHGMRKMLEELLQEKLEAIRLHVQRMERRVQPQRNANDAEQQALARYQRRPS